MDLTPHKVVIIVFGMPDCGACEDYLPRFSARVARRGRPLHIYRPGKPVPTGAVPILVYDVASPDREIQALADRYAISATPATLVLRRGPGAFKVEGSLDDAQIDHVLALAVEANQA